MKVVVKSLTISDRSNIDITSVGFHYKTTMQIAIVRTVMTRTWKKIKKVQDLTESPKIEVSIYGFI